MSFAGRENRSPRHPERGAPTHRVCGQLRQEAGNDDVEQVGRSFGKHPVVDTGGRQCTRRIVQRQVLPGGKAFARHRGKLNAFAGQLAFKHPGGAVVTDGADQVNRHAQPDQGTGNVGGNTTRLGAEPRRCRGFRTNGFARMGDRVVMDRADCNDGAGGAMWSRPGQFSMRWPVARVAAGSWLM